MSCCRACKRTEASCDLRPPCCPTCEHDETIKHRVTRYLAVEGWIASCVCGWRVACRTAERRNAEADTHTGAAS